MILGYNTNGFSSHDPLQAIKVLGELGYRCLAITVDHQWLNPFSADWREQLGRIQEALKTYQMTSVIESGARFLLDPRKKHFPTLLSQNAADRERRVDFLLHCLQVADALGSQCVSLWSGSSDELLDNQKGLDRLAHSLDPVLKRAEELQIPLAFEPEPGMFIATTADYERMKRWIDSKFLRLTMDIGHLFCLGEVPIADRIYRYRDEMVNVHIEDMNAGIHDHLMFGDGQISFPPILAALKEIDYRGPINVELSRHSHNAYEIAKGSYLFLNSIMRTR
ncbi:MAG TPA: sugar phosphate isomerase/epimerase family protein [Pirellulaceae bacterium]|nr:sugar phosphate isomerase/epimerase family protein [Pirellulaceae bacterium]HMO93615.1 sugar phosphate isomerase/epimerase family protein [Pirellulaceae bacterium]HMP70487.1 sugar phosphate isomerase/epimerase family protein [Pirellulaceae bacterium]